MPARIDWLNALPEPRARAALRACCAAPAWVEAVLAGRPYPDPGALFARADAATATLDRDGVAAALAAHPRIGERAVGDDRPAAWSRREQSAVAAADDATRAALAEANRAYERRFGHVFLIRAAGRSAAEILAAARERLTNDPAAERAVVAAELGAIARLRLERLVSWAPLSTHVLDTTEGRPAVGVPVRLDRAGETLAAGETDADGRLREWVPAAEWSAGAYRLVFGTGAYHRGGFFPEVGVDFAVTDPTAHLHLPLLLSRYGYTTYRGS